MPDDCPVGQVQIGCFPRQTTQGRRWHILVNVAIAAVDKLGEQTPEQSVQGELQLARIEVRFTHRTHRYSLDHTL